jgi:hypothetical protein
VRGLRACLVSTAIAPNAKRATATEGSASPSASPALARASPHFAVLDGKMRSVRVLITSSRMPFALGMVRRLAAEGREIYAADDCSLSSGSHSKYLAGHFVYPSPRRDTAAFLVALERIVREHKIDVIVPTFEETFYISTQIERLSRFTNVFASPFSTLARLHDKGAFETLVAKLGLPIPETVMVTSDDDLREATGRLVQYFARAAFSRGAGHRRGPSHARITVACTAVRGGRDGLQLQHRPRGAGELTPDVSHPAAAQAQHWYPV